MDRFVSKSINSLLTILIFILLSILLIYLFKKIDVINILDNYFHEGRNDSYKRFNVLIV